MRALSSLTFTIYLSGGLVVGALLRTSLPWIYFYDKPNDDGDDGGDACGDPLPNIDKVL